MAGSKLTKAHGEKLTALVLAAESYGDAVRAQERALRVYVRGDNIMSTLAATRDAEVDLQQAARAYATSTRRRRAALAAQQKGEGR